MRRTIRDVWLLAATSFGLICALTAKGPARADEVAVFAAGAVQKAVVEVAAAFEATTGHKVVASYDTVGALRDRVLAGETPDLVILSEAGLKALAAKGKLWQGSEVRLGETSVGICVPASGDWERMNIVEIDSTTYDLAARIAEATLCRSLDAIHLASATRVRGSSFLTFDIRQAQVARSLGLSVLGA